MHSAGTDPPYADLRVLELARVLAGPWIGQTLADLGAQAIKIESPQGDETRRWGPPFLANGDGTAANAAYFHSCNRGKESLVLDFREAKDPGVGNTWMWRCWIPRSAFLPTRP